MKTDNQFFDTLEDNIHERGAMDKLISDRAETEISNHAKDILRNLIIAARQSEPYHEHQNPAERRYQDVKRKTNQVLDFTGASASTWLLAMEYVCYIFNHLASSNIGGQVPLTKLTGQTMDISNIFLFSFWEPVYFATASVLSYSAKPGFPSDDTEGKGRFVGFSKNVGTAYTFKILTDDTNKIIHHSAVRSALTMDQFNKSLFKTAIAELFLFFSSNMPEMKIRVPVFIF